VARLIEAQRRDSDDLREDNGRTEMEARLGADFSDVRLHTDAASQRSAAEIGARAYTSGNHVVIGEGGANDHTLAHELTHVVQQRQGPVAGTDQGNGERPVRTRSRGSRERHSGAPATRPPGTGTGRRTDARLHRRPCRTVDHAARLVTEAGGT
jgi:Domain of unknown function (DUF4157)